MKTVAIKWMIIFIIAVSTASAVGRPNTMWAASENRSEHSSVSLHLQRGGVVVAGKGHVTSLQRPDRRPSRPPVQRSLYMLGLIDITDHETFWDQRGALLIQPQQHQVTAEPMEVLRGEKCVGGEVRVELVGNASVDTENAITFQGIAKLYEGTSCGTNDKEDEEAFTVHVASGATVCHDLTLRNGGFGGGDKATLKLRMQNLNYAQPIVSQLTKDELKKALDNCPKN